MNVERFRLGHVLCASLTGMTLVCASSVVLGQQPQPAQQSPVQQQQPPQGQQQPPQSQQQQQLQSQQQAQQPARQDDVELAAAAPAVQAAQPMWTAVRMIRVKHDRIGEFEALLKELRAALQEANGSDLTVFSTEVGQVNEYHIPSSFESLASMGDLDTPLMEPAEWASWLNRMQATIDSQTVIVARVRTDLSIVTDAQQGQAMPELMMLITDRVLPGKIREYETMMRDEVIPAMRQGGALMGMSAYEVTFGAEGRTWIWALPLPGWEVFDQASPLVQALGPQGAQELNMRADALIDSSKITLLRRADLSSEPSGQGN